MRLVSVNVSLPQLVDFRGQTVLTSIFKEPVGGRVLVRRLSLVGDWQADLRSHGGINKAVYAYPLEHYVRWSVELGRADLRAGQFGENFTLEGLTEDAARLGDVFRIGSALLQVRQPRYPCYKLGIKMGGFLFPRRFLAGGRTGFYLRVLQEGEVGAGDTVELVEQSDALTVRGLWHLVLVDKGNVEGARRALRCPTLAGEWREPLQERLRQEDAGQPWLASSRGVEPCVSSWSGPAPPAGTSAAGCSRPAATSRSWSDLPAPSGWPRPG
jgi:MOSC domain-containing protein YiiM